MSTSRTRGLQHRASHAGARMSTGRFHAVIVADGKEVAGAVESRPDGFVTYDLDAGVREQALVTEDSAGNVRRTVAKYKLDRSKRYALGWTCAALATVKRGAGVIRRDGVDHTWESLDRETVLKLYESFGGVFPMKKELPIKAAASWQIPAKDEDEFMTQIRKWLAPPEPPKPKQGQK